LNRCASAAWQLDGLEVGVAVNMSLTSLRDKDLPTRIETLLAHHSLPAEQLTLEVTEGAVMAHRLGSPPLPPQPVSAVH
jgi:EAL domain-containing protein (putative c-di-GMP-specific phosphodiesterase class I)